MFDDGDWGEPAEAGDSRLPWPPTPTEVRGRHPEPVLDWCPQLAAEPVDAPGEPDACAQALAAAVDALLAQDPAALAPRVALERARALLVQGERLVAATSTALSDVTARELFALDGAGSMPGWLRQQLTGDAGRSLRTRRLAARPQVRAALAAGVISTAAADVVLRHLDRLPSEVPEGQVLGVLANAVPELLDTWVGAAYGPHDLTAEQAARQEHVAAVLQAAAADVLSGPAERLEAPFVLVAQALTMSVLDSQLALLVDALLPEALADAQRACWEERAVRLRKKRGRPGWTLDADLTDEAGARLDADLRARQQARRQARDARQRAAEQAEADSPPTAHVAVHRDDRTPSDVGTAGPGTPRTEPGFEQPFGPPPGTPVTGEPTRTDAAELHDLLVELLDDAAASTGEGRPRPAELTVTTTLDQLEGRLGGLPGSLATAGGPIPLARNQLRRIACTSTINAVLLDAYRRPVGASGTHRDATGRQRRALRVRWGDYCAVDGCASTRTVPHHVIPFWLSRRTRLDELVPICEPHHHDVHDGHRSLRLRDGRLVDDHGWAGGGS